MGFSIGRFLGGILPEIGTAVGGAFGGPAGAGIGAVIGGAVGSAFVDEPRIAQAAAIGRATQPGPVSAGFGPSLQFQGGGRFLPTSVGPTALAGGLGRFLGRGGTALQLFGNGNGNGRNPIQEILRKAREATGGPVTRNRIIDAAKACGLETTAQTFGLDLREVCLVIVKGRTRRRRGVSAADIRRTKRTINFASKVRKDLKALAR